ncbi:porin [Hydrogenophaga atypica]|uniref:Porin n=1 Tax=Hydrogenophaga atypica TaxID=249409 RepID=A0ABW2QP69_9BURK
MKHTAIALALLGLFASAAQAQSSVKLHGRLNLTLESQKVGDASRVNKMEDNSSRWGVKGSEDLGGGMRANFSLEQGFDATTGVATGFTRESYVELAAPWGAIRGGNWTPGSYYATADYVSMHNHDTGTSSDALYAFSTFPTARKVGYFTPEIAGFTAEISHAFESATEAKANDLSVNYNAGDLQLGAGYTKQADVSQVGLRALYSMGAFTVGGYLQRESVDGSANGKSRDIVRLAAMYTMGANEFHVNVGHSDRGGSFAQKASQYTLGFNHNLTKRTKLYTYYTAINSPGKANDFNAIAVGMRHNF